MTNPDGVFLIETVVDASGVDAGVNRTKEKLGEIGAAGEDAGRKLSEGIGAGADQTAQKIDRATRSMVASIQRATAAASAGGTGTSAYYESVAKQRGLDVNTLKPYLAQLDEAVAKQNAAGVSLGNMGITAKQTAAALRGVPAQFTDIITSLQGGQAPMTVLLQQGGQLKDMFGGIGPAARALGGYVAGLINPFTLAAGAAVALGVAFTKGYEESAALNRALVMTGNQVGPTTSQLNEMSRQVAESTGATRGLVADAITQVVSLGGTSTQNIARVAEAAIKLERATGESIDKTVDKFADLGKSPVEASLKLNKEFGYLTAAIFQQIKALEDQGRATEAANLAQRAFADTISQRAGEIEGNLGAIERAWRGIKDAIKSAGDAALNVGRTGSLEQQLAAAKRELATGSFDFARTEGDVRTVIAGLEKQIAQEREIGVEKQKQAKQEQASIAWLQEGDKYLSKQEQKLREIAKIRQAGAAAGAAQTEIDKRVAAVEEKYAEKAPKGRSGGSRSDPAQTLIGDLSKSIASRQLEAEATETLTASEKRAAEIKQSLADGTLKATAAQRQEIDVRLQKLIGLEKEIAFQKELDKAEAANVKNRQAMIKQIEDANKAADLFGLNAAQISVVEQARLADAIAIAQQNGATEDQIAYLREELALRGQLSDSLIDVEKKRIAQKEAEDQVKGSADGLGEFAKQAARNAQDAMADLFINPTSKGIKSFGETFSQTLQKMVAQAGSVQLFKLLLGDKFDKTGDLGGWLGGLLKGIGGSGGGSAFGGILDWFGSLFARGAAFGAGPVSAFASGGAFGSGAVLERPTFFRFADGGAFRGGVAGEAGPEGALPLKRMNDGRLGVYFDGGGGGQLSQTLNFYGKADPQQVRRATASAARDVLGVINAAGRHR